jgi:hypothetical protein
VRNPQIVSVDRHYGLTIATCVPADPQSKGGSEATVRRDRVRIGLKPSTRRPLLVLGEAETPIDARVAFPRQDRRSGGVRCARVPRTSSRSPQTARATGRLLVSHRLATPR